MPMLRVRFTARRPANCLCPDGFGRGSTKPVVQVRLLAEAPRLRLGGSEHWPSKPAVAVRFRAKALYRGYLAAQGTISYVVVRQFNPATRDSLGYRPKARTRDFDSRYQGSSPCAPTMRTWRNGSRASLRNSCPCDVMVQVHPCVLHPQVGRYPAAVLYAVFLGSTPSLRTTRSWRKFESLRPHCSICSPSPIGRGNLFKSGSVRVRIPRRAPQQTILPTWWNRKTLPRSS